ncbi:MAG TPA: hypothetical protein EYN79_09980, partial [Planctomycetes bacterium]|nr:hypothetical protein [Planctomycetota bacterium]
MDRRFLLTIVTCFLVSMFYMQMIAPDRQDGAVPEGTPDRTVPVLVPDTIVRGDSPAVVPEGVVADPVEQFPERTIHLRNRVLDIEVTTVGAAIRSVVLQEYRESIGDDSPLLFIAPELESGPAMVLSLEEEGAGLSSISWEVIEEELEQGRLVLKLTLSGDRSVTRTYQLPDDGYEVSTSVRFEGNWPEGRRAYYSILGASRIRFDVGSRWPNQWVWASRMGSGGVAKVNHEDLGTIPSGQRIERASVWGALESNYFAQVIRAVGSDESSFDGSLLVVGEKTDVSEARWKSFKGEGKQGWPLRIGFLRPVVPGREDVYE